MMARRRLLGLLGAFGGVLTASACGMLGGSSYRFRLTVAVDTPQGLRTGSSIYEVTAGRTGAMLPDAAKRRWRVKGEAVAVDLPGGRTLFALLKTHAHFEDMMGLSMTSLHPDFRGTGYDVVGVAKQFAAGEHLGPVEIAPEDFPLLVTFRDTSDPASIMRVDPRRLATSFGTGVALRRITVEQTRDPVTTGIERKLRWLPNHRGTLKPNPPRTMPNPSDPELRLLDTGAFSTERFQ